MTGPADQKPFQIPEDDKLAVKIFEFLFNTYFKQMCKVAYRMVKDQAVSEDLVQDVFVKMWNSRTKINDIQSIKPYLYRATFNTALNYLESKKKNYPLHELEMEINKIGVATVDQQVDFLEVQKVLQDSLDLLPPKCKAIFLMIKYENLSYAETASALGVSVKTVENQMGKALKHMRRHLQDYLGYLLMIWSFCGN